jgi:FMN phosphatase YigB (HAD superfamily)
VTPQRQPVNAVLFDLGGVLVDVDLASLKRGLAQVYDCTPRRVDEAVFASGLKAAHDAGRLAPWDFHTRVNEALDRPDVQEIRFVAAWASCFVERAETTGLLPALARRCPLYVASNTDPLHAGFIRDVYPWTNLFTDAWLSFEAGALKPEPRFFSGLLEAFDLDPARTAYFDDKPDNVAAARNLGIRGFVVEGLDSVPAGLRSVGLL